MDTSNPNNGTTRVVAKLTITLMSDQEVKIEGPVHDKLQCCGLLELAKSAILNQDAKPRQAVQAAPVALLPTNGHVR